MSFLSRLWPSKKVVPLTTEQQTEKFARDMAGFFDLPWDGQKKLQEATPDIIADIKAIHAHSVRQYEENMPYHSSGVALTIANLYWQNRIKQTALVMKKLDYPEDEVINHHRFLVQKHYRHFSPRTVLRSFQSSTPT